MLVLGIRKGLKIVEEKIGELLYAEVGYQYVVRDGKAVIVGSADGHDLETVPSELGGYPVAAVTFEALDLFEPPPPLYRDGEGEHVGPDGVVYDANMTEIRSVPEEFSGEFLVLASVKRICDNAFSKCRGITTFRVDEGNDRFSSIDGKLLSGDKSALLKVPATDEVICRIPASVTGLDSEAFADWSKLEKFEVDPDNQTFCSVDGVLYSKDKSLLVLCPGGWSGFLRVPEGVVSFAFGAFFCCFELTGIRLPASVMKFDCSICGGKLRVIEVDDANPLFCSIRGVLYSKDVKSLIYCPEALGGILLIPDGVESLEDYAFLLCSGLTEVHLPASLVDIDNSLSTCFSSNLAAFKVEDGNPRFRSVGGVLYSRDMTELIRFPVAKGGYFVVPPEVEGIGDYAFCDCHQVERVDVPQTIIRIGDYAFDGCEDRVVIDRRVRLDIY